MIFDSHAHYDDEAFEPDREELLESMADLGVGTIINVGASLRGVRDTVKLMKKYPFIYGAVGVHPDEVGDLDETQMIWLRSLCMEEKTVAIGEIGLDYYWNRENHEVQKHWFVRQMDLAKEVGYPIIVHSRDAARDTLDIMKSERADALTGVIHCYSYSREHAREYMNMGYLLGIGGVATFANAKKLKEIVAYAPLDYILLETDCPYLAPEPHRGERNNSSFLTFVAREIARIKGVSYETVVETTAGNARRLFGI
ncbi:YchF/TatD family DNA exonuclease [Lactonifactor sp. BIOML-A3]|nr:MULTISPECIES: TatD family hydrolase [unclassified Lactonifactor]MSA00665.1 YchF/TatD family DNA exonuclease [Lactonifactor sp. BIOML-A5]MSA06863.1 YchF/TatD family DNA exonuclease [Lactonifactor sp. BIOML-A4]MSA11502.1 YchF/TatD family DNA exonuclease [Lactonifactor sp. BIOML-A3]MSA16095.1 YchF/TatD family DNA exonuclease [Lactonifactor sp. BIOML-A2]MSA36699.1 YchF/TatD family DNA exonuclease [Lactonifactor sp. BIOML-A1]